MGPRNSPTMGFWGKAVSYARLIPAPSRNITASAPLCFPCWALHGGLCVDSPMTWQSAIQQPRFWHVSTYRRPDATRLQASGGVVAAVMRAHHFAMPGGIVTVGVCTHRPALNMCNSAPCTCPGASGHVYVLNCQRLCFQVSEARARRAFAVKRRAHHLWASCASSGSKVPSNPKPYTLNPDTSILSPKPCTLHP